MSQRAIPRRLVFALLAAYILFVLWIVLRQSPVLGTKVAYTLWEVAVWMGAAASWTTFVWAEFTANVGMLVPITLLGSILWRRPSWRDWTAGVFLFALGVEFVQAAFLTERVPTYSDVVANTLGGFVGAVVGALLVRVAGSRHVSPGGSSARPPEDSPTY